MATLARLDVSDERIDGLCTEMNTILAYMGEISKWDVAEDASERIPARRREDTPTPSPTKLVEAASRIDGTSVVVPPVKGAS